MVDRGVHRPLLDHADHLPDRRVPIRLRTGSLSESLSKEPLHYFAANLLRRSVLGGRYPFQSFLEAGI